MLVLHCQFQYDKQTYPEMVPSRSMMRLETSAQRRSRPRWRWLPVYRQLKTWILSVTIYIWVARVAGRA